MNVKPIIKNITNLLHNVERGQPALAVALRDARGAVCWRSTDYRGWRGFCNMHVNLSFTAIYTYIKTADAMAKYKVPIKDAVEISKAIGWSRFQIGMRQIRESISVEDFITKFKGVNLNERIKFEEKESALTTFSFILPKASADLLTNELVIRGMRISNSARTNASSAMVRLIDDLLTE